MLRTQWLNLCMETRRTIPLTFIFGVRLVTHKVNVASISFYGTEGMANVPAG
jgi:hypothetical protein